MPAAEGGFAAQLLRSGVGALDRALGPNPVHEIAQLPGLVLRQTLDHPPHQLVLGRQGDEGDAEHRVEPRGEGLDGVVQLGDAEGELRALGAADPVALHDAHALRPASELRLDVVHQLLSVVGDLDEPLPEVLLGDGGMAAPAVPAVHHLLVGQDGAAGPAPVDGRLLAVDQALFVHLKEYPLIPPVVVRVAGLDAASPVVAVAHALELAGHVLDVVPGPVVRLCPVLDGGVLRGHSERVEAHGVEDVHPLLAEKACEHVSHGIVADVPHVQGSAGVGKHLETVELGARGVRLRLETPLLLPYPLPFGLDRLEIIRHRPVLLGRSPAPVRKYKGNYSVSGVKRQNFLAKT